MQAFGLTFQITFKSRSLFNFPHRAPLAARQA
jgi:hypothetical protein